MPNPSHEARHRIFQHDGELFARMMRQIFGVDVPVPDRVTVLDSDLTETRDRPYQPTVHERRADSVLLAEFLLEGPTGSHIIVIESQSVVDPDKMYSWPYYIAFLRDKYKCDVTLLVVCNKEQTADWARTPIVNGLPAMPCMIVSAIVIGPDNMPKITDLTQACTDVGLAVLSALTHSHCSEVHDILDVLADALCSVAADTAAALAEFTALGLAGTEALEDWSTLMKLGNFPYKSALRLEFEAAGEARGAARGKAEGEARSVLRVLDRRGISLTDQERERISACTDTDTLDLWIDLAITCTTAEELFGVKAAAPAGV